MKIVKWMKWLAVVGLVVLLGACGDSGGSGGGSSSSSSEKSVAKSDEASIKVSDGQYILPNGETVDEGEGFLALSVTIKNESKDPLRVSGDDISLYDEEDNKISLEHVYSTKSKFKELEYTNVSGGKTLSGYVVFKVDKDAKYTLTYQPAFADYSEDELEEVEMKIDPSDYKDESEEIAKLVNGYVDSVFLEKDDESKSKLKLANDLDAENQTYHEYFSKVIGKSLSGISKHKPTEDEANKVIDATVGANKDKAEVSCTVAELLPDRAVIHVSVKTILFADIETNDVVSTFSKDKMAASTNYDYDAIRIEAEQHMLSELPTLIQATAVRAPDQMSGEGYEIVMTFKDDEWTIDSSISSDNYQYEYLQRAFCGGLFN